MKLTLREGMLVKIRNTDHGLRHRIQQIIEEGRKFVTASGTYFAASYEPDLTDARTRELLVEAVVIDYTNHRGDRRTRRILPIDLWFGTTRWHERDGPQWFVKALDLEREDTPERDFSKFDIHAWMPANG